MAEERPGSGQGAAGAGSAPQRICAPPSNGAVDVKRRRLLATVATLGTSALGGCGESGPTRWLTSEPVTTELLTRAVGDYAVRITDPEREVFVRRLLERGSVVVDTGGVPGDVREVFDGSDWPFQYGDRVLTVDRERLGTITEWTYPLTVYYSLDDATAEERYGEPPTPGEAVNFSARPRSTGGSSTPRSRSTGRTGPRCGPPA